VVDFLEKGAQGGVGLRGRAEFDLFKGPPAATAPGYTYKQCNESDANQKLCPKLKWNL